MAVKDGLPATDFSRMNREWVKAVADGGSGGGGLPPVTEADNGRILGVVNGAWGAIDAGGGSSDFSEAEVTITNASTNGYILFPCIGAEYGGVMEDWDTLEIQMVNPDPEAQNFKIPVYKDGTLLMVEGQPPYAIAVTGSITEDNGTITVNGDGTITLSDST